MRTTFKIMFLAVFLITGNNAEAQIFKKLKDKINKTISGKSDKDESKVDSNTREEELNESKPKSFGSVIINHSNTYGNIDIEEISQVNVKRTEKGYVINGSWWSHEADIFDGFRLNIDTEDNLKHDQDNYNENTKRTFKIPEEAQLKLGYDPKLPYYEKASDKGFKRAVSDDYQNISISRGEVTVDVLSDGDFQLSFSGDVTLRKVNRTGKGYDNYEESFYESRIKGAIDAQSPKFTNTSSTNISESEDSSDYSNDQIPVITNNTPAAAPGIYQFTFETKVKFTNLRENESYKMSYSLNPKADYIALKADMSEYSDAEMQGESLIVMDNGDTHIFVETQGMKMRMSQGMMGANAMQNPAEQMVDHDYNGIQKTGNTKTILGAKCYEYVMSDDEVKMNLWVAPDVNLPNWFVQNNDTLKGHIMEYTIDSKENKMKIETIEINDNISKTINSKEYRKMF